MHWFLITSFVAFLGIVGWVAVQYNNMLLPFSQIATIVSCFGIIIAVGQYCLSLWTKKEEEIAVALSLWKFYTDEITPKADFVAKVYDTACRKEKICAASKRMHNFTKCEIDSIGRETWKLFDENDPNGEQNKKIAREIVKIACLWGIMVVTNERVGQYNNATDRLEGNLHDSETELLRQSFSQIKEFLCGKLDYFARSVLCMALDERILKENLRPEYLKTVRYLYLDICEREKKYPNIVKLYNKWNKK